MQKPDQKQNKKAFENCTRLVSYDTQFWKKLKHYKLLSTCGCLKIPYKNQQLSLVGLFSCIFAKTIFFQQKQQTTQLQKTKE